MDHTDSEKLLKIGELASKLGVQRATIYTWRSRGMPYLKIGDGKTGAVRYVWADVLEWVKQNGGRHERRLD